MVAGDGSKLRNGAFHPIRAISITISDSLRGAGIAALGRPSSEAPTSEVGPSRDCSRGHRRYHDPIHESSGSIRTYGARRADPAALESSSYPPGPRAGADLPRCPITEPNDAPFVYVRRHGPGGGYRRCYTPQHIAADAERIRAWLDAGKDVHVYHNNDIGGRAVDSAWHLVEAIG